MRGPLVCVAFSTVFVATPAPTAAQDLSMPVPCTAYGSESDSEAQARCNRERESNYNNAAIAEAQQENIRIGKELLAAVRSKPNLPAANNRLIGRWQAPRPPKVDGNADFVTGLMNGLKMLEGGLCTIMFGDGGEIEFYATGWASTDSLGRDDLGPVTYKDVGPDMVGVLPAQGIQNMVFQFDGPNTIRLITDAEGCNLTRIGAPPPATVPAAARVKSVKEQLGVDTVESIERDIKARGGSPGSIRAGSQGLATLSTLSGDYSDFGSYVTAVNYDFEGMDPTARLVGVTVVHRFGVFGDAYKKLTDERKAILAKDFGALKVKSATESSSAADAYELTLLENPDTGYLYERYKLAR